MTCPALEDTVIIGCCDINACGSRILACVAGAGAPQPLALATASPVSCAVSSPDLPDFEAATVCTCTNLDGKQVTVIRLNVVTEEFSGVAHQVVQWIQNSSNVSTITVIGAMHLPQAEAHSLHHLILNNCSLPPNTTSTELPGKTPLSDPSIAALYYWLAASGVPATFLLIPGYKAPRHAVHEDAVSDVEDLKGLLDVAMSTLRLKIDDRKIACLKFNARVHEETSKLSKTGLMYV